MVVDILKNSIEGVIKNGIVGRQAFLESKLRRLNPLHGWTDIGR